MSEKRQREREEEGGREKIERLFAGQKKKEKKKGEKERESRQTVCGRKRKTKKTRRW